MSFQHPDVPAQQTSLSLSGEQDLGALRGRADLQALTQLSLRLWDMRDLEPLVDLKTLTALDAAGAGGAAGLRRVQVDLELQENRRPGRAT